MVAEHDDERALVAALRRGDTDAFDVVYDRHRRRVFSFVLRMSGDRALAEDLLQDTFVRLATRARSLEPETRLRPWLFTVARNLFLDRRRRRLLGFERLRELARGGASVAVRTPLEVIETQQTAARVGRALLALPSVYREAVLLCAVEGFAPAEAASIVGIEPAAMRQRLARGRARLRKAIER